MSDGGLTPKSKAQADYLLVRRAVRLNEVTMLTQCCRTA